MTTCKKYATHAKITTPEKATLCETMTPCYSIPYKVIEMIENNELKNLNCIKHLPVFFMFYLL